jgi:phytoene dehydrogenase-like protein
VTQLRHLGQGVAPGGRPSSDGTELHAGAVVIGAGLGGLLAALRLAREGRDVLVLERADRPGGRFTAASIRGAEVATGALHLIPNGSGGALARLLRQLAVPVRIVDADVFCSVWSGGEQIVCPRGRDVFRRVLSPAERRASIRLAARLLAGGGASCDVWLRSVVPPGSRLYGLWRAFSEFALSVPLERVAVGEMRSVALRTLRDGLPGVPQGGCRAVIDALVAELERRGGRLLLGAAVERIVLGADAATPGSRRVVGVHARGPRTGRPLRVGSSLVVSDIGAEATLRLCASPDDGVAGTMAAVGRGQVPAGAPATGFKIQLLSPEPLVPHRSVMLCLGTERVAGVAQPSNGDPGLAPPGGHLVMSHQVLGGDSIAEARAAGLRDLRRIFGDVIDRAEVLSAAGFQGRWPVNRAGQGGDVLAAPSISGLHWVGDGHKPRGYMMVEGVAESVRRLRVKPARVERR